MGGKRCGYGAEDQNGVVVVLGDSCGVGVKAGPSWACVSTKIRPSHSYEHNHAPCRLSCLFEGVLCCSRRAFVSVCCARSESPRKTYCHSRRLPESSGPAIA